MSIIPPAAGTEYISAYTLKALSNSFTDVGVWTITLRATLQNYPTITAATKVITSATVLDPCCGATMSTTTMATPLDYQLKFSQTAPYTIMTFTMNADTIGTMFSNPMFCGVKTYATGFTWLTVLTPADPATQVFSLQVSTNDYLLTGSYTVNIVVTFANVLYTGTITQTITVNLLHPCKITLITTPQTISTITFPFGGATVLTPYTNFLDTVSAEYSIPTLCGLVYSISVAADATIYGTTIVVGAPNQISVYTNDPAIKGTQKALNLFANATPQQDTPSQIVPFIVEIQDTCTIAVLTFNAFTFAAMTSTVTQAAATQSFTFVVDSISTSSAIFEVCGAYNYVFVEGYPFLSIDPVGGIVTLQTNDMTKIGVYTATFSASLNDYPTVPPA
jgi:PKD repeat protein